jgi:hypothetical protein
MHQPERGRNDEHATLGGFATVGHHAAEADGQRDEGFDPGTRVTDPAEGDRAERHAMAERENQRAAEGLAERRRAQEHRQHEQAMVPAIGQHVAEAVRQEREGRLVGGRRGVVAELE